jgi:hypothetical protein
MKKLILLCFILLLNQAYAQDSLSVSKRIKKTKNFSKSIFIVTSLDNKTIELLPYADMSKLRLLNSPAVYYGNSYQLQGMPSSEDNFIVDGMQVSDISFFPMSAVSNYRSWSTTNPIEYGNSLCGIIEINSIVPIEKSTFKIKMLSNTTAGKLVDINQKHVTFMYGSPFSFLKSRIHDQKLMPSVLIAGNLNFMKDPNPSYIGSIGVNDDTYSLLYNTPLIPTGHDQGTYMSAEFVTKDNFQTNALRKNSGINSFNPYIKILLPLTKNISIAMGSYMNIIWGKEGLYRNAMFNSDMNPDISENNYNNYIRLNHEIINSKDLKLNYQLQLNYIYRTYKRQSAQHKDNFFEYGYVGKFKTHSVKNYEIGTDTATGITAHIQNGFADTLVSFQETDINPGLSNYTQSYYNYYNTAPGHYRNLNEIQLGGALINGYFGTDMSSYDFWNNVSMPDDNYMKGQFSRVDPKLTINFIYKEKHHITLGFEYDKTDVSYYTLHPVGLWQVMDLQVNKHINQLDLAHPHLINDANGVFQDTIWYDRIYSGSEQSLIDNNLRQKLGLATNGTDWIDVYNYDPSTFSIDMFSADELLNEGNSLVDYCGYDYTGHKTKIKNSLDFFNEMGSNGRYSRNIAPFKPVYLNAYAQYTYNSKRFNITAGLRIDRYDANQPVLKDPYLFFAAKTASEVNNLGPHPDNIGDDFVVYVDDVKHPTAIKGYRNGNTWYNSHGTKIDDPSVIQTSSGIAPYLIDPDQMYINTSAFTDYKPAINYLPLVDIDYLLLRNTQLFGSFQMITENPFNNNFRPQQYWFFYNIHGILNNPDLKPDKLTVIQISVKQIVLKSMQLGLNYLYKSVKGLPVVYRFFDAYPSTYTTLINCPDNFTNHAIDVSVMYKKPGKHEINAGIFYERLLSENKTFYYIPLSKNVANGFVEYSMNNMAGSNGVIIPRPIFSISLAGHFRSETYSLSHGSAFSTVVGRYNLPDFYYFDIKLEKQFYLGKNKNMCATVFVSVQNILNKKNVYDVYPSTGKSDDDGYLSNPYFQASIQATTNEQAYRDQYSAYINDPRNYDIPRMLLFGFSFGL